MNGELTIATCQFPVSADIDNNRGYIRKLIIQAKRKGAEIAHFSESSLSGYAGIDFNTFEKYDETLLRNSLDDLCQLSAELKIWVIVGGHQYGKDHAKPFNCLWIINDRGKIIDRYDKRLLFGKDNEQEHFYYQSGERFVQFELNGIKCGLLICHEWRYPELYREHMKMGTELLFQSWYDGNLSKKSYLTDGKELGTLITGTVRGNAANNYLWISASNTSKAESSFASFLARPDGRIVHQLKRNVTSILISRIDFTQEYVDPSRSGREKLYPK